MLEKPHLADEKIIACIKETYGLTASELEFLPLGYDSNAGVYRAQANGQSYFVKVRRDAVDELSLLLPRYLKEHGLEEVIPPLPTIIGNLWGRADGFNLILYPFVEEFHGDLSDRQWIEFGAIVRKLHTIQLPPDLLRRLPRENFVPPAKWTALAHRFQVMVCDQDFDHPLKRDLAAFWQEQVDEIELFINRSEQIGRLLQQKSLDFVLCHADIHIWNLLPTPQGDLFVVDWDQPMMAPIERDLMFTTLGAFVPEQRHEDLFFQGYGKTDIDPLVMAYYRYERTMEDLAGFGEIVFLADTNDESKQDAVSKFKRQFEPGSQVDSAHKLDRYLV